ncbi:MAG: ATP-binding protein [Gammaproteobacteria bacterium]|nr:ATP-binding protein [Gammaproteobacteria bacterium]MCY4357837.1 ATP-binding protein [Gammaproteobacteria bacterium]
MQEVIGNPEVVEHKQIPTFRLQLFEGPLELAWKHCDITADFLGKLHAVWSGQADTDANEIRHNVSYIINEMLENAVKFSCSPCVELDTGLGHKKFLLRIVNAITRDSAMQFQELLNKMEKGDPSSLLIERLEFNAADPNLTGSGLGLLTLMSDYSVEFFWKFAETDDSEFINLEAHASLPLE